MISVSGDFIPFIFKICQINVGIDMISWFHDFFISNFSADFFQFGSIVRRRQRRESPLYT